MNPKDRVAEVKLAIRGIILRVRNGTLALEEGAFLILNHKDKEGKPMLGIISDDQRKPDCEQYRYMDLEKGGWLYDVELMAKTCPCITDNFVRIIKS